MSLILIIKKLLLREKSSSKEYISFLRKKGVSIGENCVIYEPRSVRIDLQNPWMLSLGNYVRITAGVQILTHDYSLSVLSSHNGNIVGSVQEVSIGNNVFIGRNAIILKGVHIGNNVIVGAGSVVSKDCEDDSVYAGVPARRICSIEDMYKRWKETEIKNAKTVAINYFNRTGKIPDEIVLREFQELFTDRKVLPQSLNDLIEGSGTPELCREYYNSSKPTFSDLMSFIKWCGIISD